MQLVPLATCSAGGCPTVFDTDGEDVVVQGLSLADAAGGETRVLLPRTVFVQAAERLRVLGAPGVPPTAE
jgi:hypothetical protein